MKRCKFFPLILAASVWSIGSSMLSAQEAKNVVLTDFVSAEILYQRATSFPYATSISLENIWGWTYNGNEYALVYLGSKQETGSGLAMVKVTDPKNVLSVHEILQHMKFLLTFYPP